MGRSKLFRLGKCWQGDGYRLVWQISLASPLLCDDEKRKCFLVIDYAQAHRGFSLTMTKPHVFGSTAPAVALLRKYIPAAWVCGLMEDSATGDIWMSISTGQHSGSDQFWHIRLSRDKPPELSAILPDKTQIFRLSQKGSYTKRKVWSGPLPDDELCLERGEDLFPSLLSQLKRERDGDGVVEAAFSKTGDSEEVAGDITYGEYQRRARKKLRRRLKTVMRACQKQEKAVPAREAVEELKQQAELLQTWLFMVSSGQSSLRVKPEMSGLEEELCIRIDPKLSPGANVEKLFRLYRKQSQALASGTVFLERLRRQIERMKSDLLLLEMTELSESEVQKILDHHGLSERMQAPSQRQSCRKSGAQEQKHSICRVFGERSGEMFYVGKSPADNDQLTRSARSDDYWLHVIAATGSHVIVPRRTLHGRQLSPETKRTAAILALHYSKFRNDCAGEVYVTQRRFLRKQKGLPAGLWLVDQSDTYYLRYTEKELHHILEKVLT